MEEEKILDKSEEEKPQAQYARKFTLDGEVLVEKKGEQLLEHPLKDVELAGLPPLFREIHMSEIRMFHSLLLTIRKSYPNRVVPITKTELFKSGATTKLIRQLCEMGFLKEDHVALLTSDGKNRGSRVCYFYTPQGRALVRNKIDPNYAKTGYS
jgi:hypothetical protein